MIRLALRVRRPDAERVLADLVELAPAGVEEVDLGETVEYAIYGAPGELPELPDLRAASGGALVEVVTTAIDDDWGERWRAFHRPVAVGDRLLVRPPWHDEHRGREDPGAGRIDVVVDPGQAFGTGSHETTRLCLELLLDVPAGGPLLDLGCGSGVLAVTAAKLGFAPVVAVDLERPAIDATRGNAAANGVAVEARRVDLRRDAIPAAPTATANLLRPLLLELAGRRDWEPPRTLIASGLLAGEADEVAGAFAARGLRERDRRTLGQWAALLLTGPGG